MSVSIVMIYIVHGLSRLVISPPTIYAPAIVLSVESPLPGQFRGSLETGLLLKIFHQEPVSSDFLSCLVDHSCRFVGADG